MRKLAVVLIPLLLFAACGGGSAGSGNNFLTTSPQFTYSVSATTMKLFPSGSSGMVNISVSRNGSTGSLTANVSGLPQGATAQTGGLGTTSAGTLTISPGSAAAGTYSVSLTLSDGQVTVTQQLALTIGVNASVDTATTGSLNLFMSTSFQPAEWDYQFFQNF